MKSQIGTSSRVVILAITLTVMFSAVTAAPARAASDLRAALTIVALINEWRMNEGLPPLRINKKLEALAVGQAEYIRPFVDGIENYQGYHIDSIGRYPVERALAEPYLWPSYGRKERTEIGENAAVGSVKFAMRFWAQSPVHRKATLNPAYREIGVGAVPHPQGYVFIVVFGAAPDVLPITLAPDGRTLYLTREQSRWAVSKHTQLNIRIFDREGRPISEFLPWSASLRLPDLAAGRVTVGFYNNREAIGRTEVNLLTDFAVLPTTADLVYSILLTQPTEVAVQPTATRTSTPTLTPTLPTLTPSATTVSQAEPTEPPSSVTATPLFSEPTATPTAMPAQPSATPTPTSAPTGNGQADLLVIYSARSLFVVNNSKGPVNLTDIVVGRIAIATWNNIAPFPMERFPTGNCLAAIQSGASAAVPTGCKLVRSEVNPSRLFWTEGSFTVRRGDVTLATCPAAPGECAVDLP